MKSNSSRNTKIICTLGPATETADRIRGLITAGMDVARLNFSHGDHESHRKTIRAVRNISDEMGRVVGILQDLGGPKIRVGKLQVAERRLLVDERVILSPAPSKDPEAIPVNYPYIDEDVSAGDRILLSDGMVELQVDAIESKRVICRVILGGVISSHKGVNLPTSRLRVPAFTDKDRQDLQVGLEEGVDFVALSFVRHESDLDPIREVLDQQDIPPLLIAKVEKPQAIERLDFILESVDGLMVARGDLGVEMPLEDAPITQKRVIRKSRLASKPVITATQMLRSMIDSPRPSRAEATDVANAILDGTDALMLSDETAVGSYPVEAVQILDRIARVTEAHLHDNNLFDDATVPRAKDTESAIGRSAAMLAADLKAAAIVAATFSGSTARRVARFRPACPVVGLTPNPRSERQLTLSWGVIPALVAPFTESQEINETARHWAINHGLAGEGDRLIVTAGVPVDVPGTTNLITVVDLH
jgi:pyruvate kinase